MALKIKENRGRAAGSGLDHFAADHDAARDRREGDADKRDDHAGDEPDGEGGKEAGIKRDDRGQHGHNTCNAAEKLARRAEIQFAYAIGYPEPVSVYVNTFGTAQGGISDAAITKAVEQVFSFKPADIVKQLNLLRPIYSKTTNYGHFGKDDKDLTWEKTDKVAALKKAIR